MLLGAQLYTVRDYIQNEKDIRYSLKKIADIGYTTVQISAMGKIEPQVLREICDELGLKIVLTHSALDRILGDTEALIKEHDILGCEYIGLGAMPERYRNGWWLERFADDFKEPCKKMAAAGKRFMYHNHHFEFEKVGGKRILETLIESFTPEELGITLDTFWVQAAGGDVLEWLEILKDRIPCVHLKDLSYTRAKERAMMPVMEGNMNFKAILKKLDELKSTKYMLVEQDDCNGEDPFACLKKSYDNVSALGYK